MLAWSRSGSRTPIAALESSALGDRSVGCLYHRPTNGPGRPLGSPWRYRPRSQSSASSATGRCDLQLVTTSHTPELKSTPAMKPAAPADAARVLETATAQRAVRAWGPVEQQVQEISGGSQPVFVLIHPERDIYTFIDNSPGALSGNEPAAVSLGVAPTAEHALRYYTADGVPLADLTVTNGRTIATPVLPRPGEAVPEIVPGIPAWQIACFAGCIGRKSGAQCIITCEHCFYYAVGTLARVIACSNCLVCAGPNGVPCLRECGII